MGRACSVINAVGVSFAALARGDRSIPDDQIFGR